MTGDEREIVEERGPIDNLEFGLQLMHHSADGQFQIVQSLLERLQQGLTHFLLALHGEWKWIWRWVLTAIWWASALGFGYLIKLDYTL